MQVCPGWWAKALTWVPPLLTFFSPAILILTVRNFKDYSVGKEQSSLDVHTNCGGNGSVCYKTKFRQTDTKQTQTHTTPDIHNTIKKHKNSTTTGTYKTHTHTKHRHIHKTLTQAYTKHSRTQSTHTQTYTYSLRHTLNTTTDTSARTHAHTQYVLLSILFRCSLGDENMPCVERIKRKYSSVESVVCACACACVCVCFRTACTVHRRAYN